MLMILMPAPILTQPPRGGALEGCGVKRWHEELPLMLRRWRDEQRRHRESNRLLYGIAAVEDT